MTNSSNYRLPYSRFYGRCQFGDKRFGPVQGSNKKEVRTAIARLALDELKSDNIDSKVAAQKLFVNSDAAETSRNECSGSDMNTDGQSSALLSIREHLHWGCGCFYTSILLY